MLLDLAEITAVMAVTTVAAHGMSDVEFIGIQHHHDLHFRSPAVLLYRGQPVVCPVFFPARRAVI